MAVSQRAADLKRRVIGATPRVCSERARLVTESYRGTEGEPALLRRAEALRHILEQKTLTIADGELIVGNQAPIPRGAEVFPEFAVGWVLEELDEFERRDSDVFLIDAATKRELRELLPYWCGKTTRERALERISTESCAAHREMVYILTSLSCGIGHIAVDYERCIRRGLRAVAAEAAEREDSLVGADAEAPGDDSDDGGAEARERGSFYRSARIVCDAAIRFAERLAELARTLAGGDPDTTRRDELLEIARICEKVPARPAETFHEAIQSFWFVHLILQIESNGHSISPGRLDQYLYPFYRADLDSGRMSGERARELLECLWIKMNEIMKLRDRLGSKAFGGYPLFQNLIVGGVDADGNDAANDLSTLCMQVTRDLSLPQPSLSVRWHEGAGRSFMREAALVVRSGIGMPAFFNDEVIIPVLTDLGCSLEEARGYAEVGCVEPQVPGATEGYYPAGFLNLAKVLEITLNGGINPLTGTRLGPATGEAFESFDALYAAYRRQLLHFMKLQTDAVNAIDAVHSEHAPTPFCSCFVDDCLASGRDVRRGGARYNLSSPNAVGLANVADALLVLERGVFEDALVSIDELRRVLSDDFKGSEGLRLRLLDHYPKFGNDRDEVDRFAADIGAFLSEGFRRIPNIRGGRFEVGLQSISAHALFVDSVGATPDGRRKAMLLADGGCSAAQGRDRAGPTAIMRSVSKIDPYRIPNGMLLNVKLSPGLIKDESGLDNLISLIEGYFALEGQHVQFNVLSTETLRRAQSAPEEHRDLLVRVAGFSVYFVGLDRILQEDIIQRTDQERL